MFSNLPPSPPKKKNIKKIILKLQKLGNSETRLQKSTIKAHFHKPLKSPEEVKYQRAITVSSKREIPSITVKSNHRDM